MGCRSCIFLSFAALIVILCSTGSTSRPIAGEEAVLPVTYGQVLYRYNAASPKQLYIIGISHEDTLSGSKSPYTPRVEAEVYRIGAWLARERGVELLLPEGFFEKPGPPGVRSNLQGGSPSNPAEMDLRLLEQLFSSDKSPLNAETLLSENFHLVVKQVEEQALYGTVHDGIQRLSNCTNLQEHFLIRYELDYHQDKRVATMLQNIPKTIHETVIQGKVQKENALFTIGLSHIPSILRFLRDEKVAISCPVFTSAPSSTKFEEFSDPLNLAKEGFGVTVILPRTLADDQRLLKRNRIKNS